MTSFEIAELLKKEGTQDVTHAFFLLLREKKVSFVELSKWYTHFLETEIKENSTVITELAFSLAMYKNPMSNAGSQEQLRTKANKAIVASKVFKGTPYEQELLTNSEEHYNPDDIRRLAKSLRGRKS